MYKEIGKIAFQYALFEYRLIRTCYTLLDISNKQGRIALREPRGIDLVDMVADLAELRELKIDFDFAALKTLASDLNSDRDKLAHGVWVYEKPHRRHYLIVTRGSWQPDKRQRGSVKRKIKPEGLHYEVHHLKQTSKEVTELARISIRLNRLIVREVRKQRRAAQSQERNLRPARTRKRS